MRKRFALAGVAIVALLPLLLGATSGASRSSTVSCGDTLTVSVVLTGNLLCGGGSGLSAGKSGIIINLNGHIVSGSAAAPVGVDAAGFSNVTIENGVILGFVNGVSGAGGGTHVEKLKVVDSAAAGIALSGGTGDLVTGNFVDASGGVGISLASTPVNPTVTSNYVEYAGSTGIELNGPTNATVSTNTAVSSTGEGIAVFAGTGRVTGNVANGNTSDGIEADGQGSSPQTLSVSGNRASFNGGLGIAASVELDAGRNVVQGNVNATQCAGIVCDAVSS